MMVIMNYITNKKAVYKIADRIEGRFIRTISQQKCDDLITDELKQEILRSPNQQTLYCYFLIPDCHQVNTTCHLMCERSRNNGQNECSSHNEQELHRECILDPHPAVIKVKKINYIPDHSSEQINGRL